MFKIVKNDETVKNPNIKGMYEMEHGEIARVIEKGPYVSDIVLCINKDKKIIISLTNNIEGWSSFDAMDTQIVKGYQVELLEKGEQVILEIV